MHRVSEHEPTPAELLLLGLLAEQPRHGYDLDAVIRERGARQWTHLGFSSIYYVLNRLEERGLVTSEKEDEQQKARRTFSLTDAGWTVCIEGTRDLLEDVVPLHSPVLVGIANSSLLPPDEVEAALGSRRHVITMRLDALRIMRDELDLSQSATVIFDHGLGMLEAELAWIDTTITTLKGTS